MKILNTHTSPELNRIYYSGQPVAAHRKEAAWYRIMVTILRPASVVRIGNRLKIGHCSMMMMIVIRQIATEL